METQFSNLKSDYVPFQMTLEPRFFPAALMRAELLLWATAGPRTSLSLLSLQAPNNVPSEQRP